MGNSRSVRIFLSSTFRDFGEERDLLVKRVFPALRARLKDRFVELVDVDLRWGITGEEAERGEVLPICLAEIDRARPYFICMLGERYGWIPPPEGYASDLLEQQPWLKKHHAPGRLKFRLGSDPQCSRALRSSDEAPSSMSQLASVVFWCAVLFLRCAKLKKSVGLY